MPITITMDRGASAPVTSRAPTSPRSPASRVLTLLVAVVTLGLAVCELAPLQIAHADPATGPGLVTRTTAGNLTAGTVPDGTCFAKVAALGAGGASSASTGVGATGGQGGPGAQINATIAVLPLQSYGGSVGGGGAVARTGGTGGGGTGTNAAAHDGAGGGGRSLVTLAGVTSVVAGGGGGGGGAHQNAPAGTGGAAGNTLPAPGVVVGGNGSAGTDTTGVPGGGTGGQVAAGGAGGVHTTQVARNGSAGGGTATGTGGNGGTDTTDDGAGGGGAGYTGGGGGAATQGSAVTGAGGGGGSSFVVATSPVVSATVPSAVSGSAGATPALAAAGATGSVSIDWLPCLYDLSLTKTASPATVRAGGKVTWTIAITNNGPAAMTRGDTITLTDTLPGPTATSPTPVNKVISMTTSGGSNTNLTRGAVTCTGLAVGSSMPASTTCTRAYAGATGTPGTPSGGTRGLDVGETLTIVYEQVVANTAPCGTITNTASVVDRPTQTGTTDIVGQNVTNNSPGTVTVQCYDLQVTKSVSPKPLVAQAGTLTWIVTVTNLGPADMVGPDATASNPLVVTDTFPTTGVGAATLTSSVGPAGACSFVTSTVTCPTGLLSGQSQVLTFTQSVNAAAAVGLTISNTASVTDFNTGDTNDSGTDSTQVGAQPRLTLRKSLGGQARFSNSDQFVMTISGTGGGSATTSGTGSTISGGIVTVATASVGATYTLSEAMAAGSVSALGQYNNSISCTNAAGISTTVLPVGAGTSFGVVPKLNDDITCTFTNTPRPAVVRIAKVTTGGIGTFGFTMTNLSSASTSVTTTVAGAPATSSAFTATAFNTAVVIAETLPATWSLTGATCVDANAAITGNSGSFGTLGASGLTIPAVFLEPAADITCTFSDLKLARLVIQKTAVGSAGTFAFNTTGGLSPASFSLSPNPPATPTVSQTFADLTPGTFTVTETLSALFKLTDITCVNAPAASGGSTNSTNLTTGLLSVTLVAGADYTCTYTNVRNGAVTVIKTTVGGDDTFSYITTGSGNTTDPAPSITTVGGVGSAAFDVPFAPGVTTRTVTIIESAPPSGWVLTAIACLDSANAPVGTANIGTRSATIMVGPGQTFSCRFTNERLPRVTIRKQSVGGTGPFTFSGGTNGLPASLTLDTSVTNPAASGVYTLTALGTATSIDETVPANYILSSAGCVDGGGSPVSTSLSASTLTIAATAVVGGANLTCTFVDMRKSAQVRFDKRWLGAIVNDTVTVSSTGGTNNPSLVSTANTSNEVDAGTPVTVYAGETLAISETFNIGTAANYDRSLACTGAADPDPTNGLAITAADDGATIVCTFTNSRIPNVSKTAGGVSGPAADGRYTVTYAVVVDNPGDATTYGALVDTPNFSTDLQVTGATWTTSASSGAAPSGGSATGPGPFTLAPAGQSVGAAVSHTYNVAITFRFLALTQASACAGPATGLYNAVTTASSELTAADNSACVPPPPPPAPSIDVVKSALPSTVTAAGQSVSYSFVVTNTGNVTLTGVVVTDPLVGLSAVTCPGSVLAPTGSMTCAATYAVTQANVDAGGWSNTATVTGTPPSGPNVSDTSSATVSATRTPSIDVVKSATPTTVTAAGQVVTYSFVVTNTGNVTLTGIVVTDPLVGLSAITCPGATLAPTVSMTCAATYTVSQANVDAGGWSNTVTVTATQPSGPNVSDTSTVTVTAPPTLSIDLLKQPSPTTVTAAGQVVTYSFIVTNGGNVTLTGVVVTDPLSGLSAIACPGTVLTPSGSMTCTAAYTVTQADMDAGGWSNTAIATGISPAGPYVSDSSTVTVTATQTPSIDVVKSASPSTVTAAGEVVAYSFVVTNTGNVTLTGIVVSDPLVGLSAITCPGTILTPSASMTCAVTYTVAQADIDAGGLTNSATVTGTPPIGAAVTASSTTAIMAIQASAVDLLKVVTPANVTAAGQGVTYSFVATNSGNVTLSTIVVTDAMAGLSAITCPSGTLAPGLSVTCTATYTVTQSDIDAGGLTNTAAVSGTPPTGPDAADTATATLTASTSAAIDLLKLVTPANVTTAGQVVTYSFVVANSGNVTLNAVVVADPLSGLSAISCPGTSLAPGGSMTCTATYTVTQADIDAGGVANTAVVTATSPTGPDVSDTATATVTSTQLPSIDVAKSASPTTVSTAGQVVTYSFVVTNTGNVTLIGIALNDPLFGLNPITCPGTALSPAAAMTCTVSYSVTQADVDAGGWTNTATVTASPPGGAPVAHTASAAVTVTQTPSIDLVKQASPATVTAAGQTVTYSFVISNTGNVTLTAVVVTDPLAGLSAIACPVATLAPQSTVTCTATYTVTQADVDTGIITNTATVTATSPIGPPLTALSSVTVTSSGSPSLGLVKMATPTTVSAVDQVVTYSFVVTNTGTVTLTGLVVSDPMVGLSAITCPETSLAPGASMMCTATYAVTQADLDAGGFTNTATVSGTPPVLPSLAPPSGASLLALSRAAAASATDVTATASTTVMVVTAASITVAKLASSGAATAGDTITYSFIVTNTGNVTLTGIVVTDDLAGLSAISCPGTTLAPGASITCTATYTVTQIDVDRGTIYNAATVAALASGSAIGVSTGASVVVPFTRSPAVSLSKTVSADSVVSGAIVTYTFVVTNTGNVTLTGVEVTDPLAGLSALNCGAFDGNLDPGETATCTATYMALASNAVNGSITNSASVTASSPAGGVSSATASADLAVRPGTLPSTGGDIGGLIGLGWLSISVGALLRLLARRRVGRNSL